MKRIILHIGTHKTGTTSVQRVLTSHREELKENGVFYPFLDSIYDSRINHSAFTSALVNKKTAKNIFDNYLNEFELSGCETMLISTEAFCKPQIQKPAIKLLKAYTQIYKFSILCVFKRQDYFLESLYTIHVRARSSGMSFDGYLNSINPRRYDYNYILDQWGRLTSDVIVHNFDEIIKNGDLTDSLLSSAGLQPLHVITGHDNRSPDRRLLQLMATMNNLGLSYSRRLLDKLHCSIYSHQTRLRQFFSPGERQKFLEQYSEQNRHLAQNYGVRFGTSIPDSNESDEGESININYVRTLIEQLSRWSCRKGCAIPEVMDTFVGLSETELITKLALMSNQRLVPDFIGCNDYKEEIKKNFYTNLNINNINRCRSIVNKLQGYFPDCITTDVALAEYFHLKKDWDKECGQWQKCIVTYSSQKVDNWRHRVVRCQLNLGNYTSAMRSIENLIDTCTENYHYQITKANIYIRSGNSIKAAGLLKKLIKTYPKRPAAYGRLLYIHKLTCEPIVFKRLAHKYSRLFPKNMAIRIYEVNAYTRMNKIGKAENKLKKIIDMRPNYLPAYRTYFHLAQTSMNVKRQRKVLNALQYKLSKISVQNANDLNIPNLYQLRAKISFSLSDRNTLKYCINKITHNHPNDEFLRGLKIIMKKMDVNRDKKRLDEKVFAIGLSKTGTTSINEALEILGYHSTHYINKYTGRYINLDDAYLFDALSDITTSCIFEELHNCFPNAKFIYTVRDKKSWLKSIKHHYMIFHHPSDIKYINKLGNSEIYHHVHTNLYSQYNSWEEAYDSHHKRVMDFFSNKPKNKLLILDITEDGQWEKLCPFLNKNMPNVDFPWNNMTPQTRTRLNELVPEAPANVLRNNN